ncbi:hypothetical protein SAMN03097699_1392 [Flavobacteriaceae bacterium MAR_2010_188]|nr:hypothetical protein SAMN03097699_1392 [Flavobacteriaceae bacterium MAR_2010_188]
MKIKNHLVVSIVFLLALVACNKDDEDGGIPEADRTEQQAVDKDTLLHYLSTHYYNFTKMQNPENFHIDSLTIYELPDDGVLPNPEDNHLLINDVTTITKMVDETLYDYYILRLNQGGGELPDFTDNVRVNYEGSLENGNVFDSTANPIVFDLLGVVPGWRFVLPTFNTAVGDPIENEDGTISYNDYGFGMMFIPSGLAYFSSPPPGLPIYSNLIFKFELYRADDNDHDSDGILSQFEDLNGNGNVFDDDTDEDGQANYRDVDDDGDGILTIFEDLNGDGDPSNDLNAAGVPLYLDKNSRQSTQDN